MPRPRGSLSATPSTFSNSPDLTDLNSEGLDATDDGRHLPGAELGCPVRHLAFRAVLTIGYRCSLAASWRLSGSSGSS